MRYFFIACPQNAYLLLLGVSCLSTICIRIEYFVVIIDIHHHHIVYHQNSTMMVIAQSSPVTQFYHSVVCNEFFIKII